MVFEFVDDNIKRWIKLYPLRSYFVVVRLMLPDFCPQASTGSILEVVVMLVACITTESTLTNSKFCTALCEVGDELAAVFCILFFFFFLKKLHT